ncbi:MAG: hypothetical protein RBU29_06570 [bacterium]|nr:hypothetical protein [bacterium]
MSFMDQYLENGVEKYMELIQRLDSLLEEAEASSDTDSSGDERIEDLQAIRNEFITNVKNCGINKTIIEKTDRMLSVF